VIVFFKNIVYVVVRVSPNAQVSRKLFFINCKKCSYVVLLINI